MDFIALLRGDESVLNNDQLYVLTCLRRSLCGKAAPDYSTIENEQNVIDVIRRNSIILTIYKYLSLSLREKLKMQYNMAIMQSITQDYEGKRIIQRMRDEGVTFLGLKGWELRNLYPEFTMRQMIEMDKRAVSATLEELGLSVFTDRMVQLSKACFSEIPMDEKCAYLFRHACKYGIFGTEKSYKTARVVARGEIGKGRLAALKDAVLPPYNNMKVMYPELEKHPSLLPYYWSKRLIGKSHKLKKNIQKMDYSVVTEESFKEIQRFLVAGGYNTEVVEEG